MSAYLGTDTMPGLYSYLKNDSCICVYINHSYVCHDSYIRMSAYFGTDTMPGLYLCEKRLMHMCVHQSFVCVPWLIHVCATWLIHMCAVTRSYKWHEGGIWLCDDITAHIWMSHVANVWMRDDHTLTWSYPHSYMCDVTHWHVCHDSLIQVTWSRDMIMSAYVGKRWSWSSLSHVTHMNESCHTYRLGIVSVPKYLRIWMSHPTNMNESCHTCEWVMSHIWI